VVEHQVDDHPDAAGVRGVDQPLQVLAGPVVALHRVVVHDVVAVIAGGLGHRHQPEQADAELAVRGGVAVVEMIEPGQQTREVADPVGVAVREAAHEHLVADRVAEPVGGGGSRRRGEGQEQDEDEAHWKTSRFR
jgi:hypothetical protein